jgi:hypothetical protein
MRVTKVAFWASGSFHPSEICRQCFVEADADMVSLASKGHPSQFPTLSTRHTEGIPPEWQKWVFGAGLTCRKKEA